MFLFIDHYQHSISIAYHNKNYFACICVAFPFIEYLLRGLMLRSTENLTVKEGNNLYKKSKTNYKILDKINKINPQIFNNTELKRIEHLIRKDCVLSLPEICDTLIKNNIIDNLTSDKIKTLFKLRNKILHGNIAKSLGSKEMPVERLKKEGAYFENETHVEEDEKIIHIKLLGLDLKHHKELLDDDLCPLIQNLIEKYYQTSTLGKILMEHEQELDDELKILTNQIL